MKINDRIEAAVDLGSYILTGDKALRQTMEKAERENPWFTFQNIHQALDNIATFFLNRKLLGEWLKSYSIEQKHVRKNVGLVMAGNIPLVGFHDMLCCFMAGHRSLIKYSEKDRTLLPFLLNKWSEFIPAISGYFEAVEKLNQIDAVIATGSNNAAVHFEYYFRDYPRLIRKNRNGVAVLRGVESKKELRGLAEDIFSYFGLGCRNISKIYTPREYSVEEIFEHTAPFEHLFHHHKYKNNYDYNYAVYLLNKENFKSNGWFILREHPDIASRIASIHYERYDDLQTLSTLLKQEREKLQCVVSREDFNGIKTIPFGSTQKVQLGQYADGVDTLDFLMSLE